MQQTSDEELLQRFQQGEEEAFTTIVQRYDSLLLTMVRHTLENDIDLAYDVCQHVWFQLFLKKPLQQGKLIKAWLFTVARNRCIDELRRVKKQPLVFSRLESTSKEDNTLSAILVDPTQLPEAIIEKKEYSSHLQLALEHLPPSYQVVLRLRVLEEYSFPEIAYHLHENNNTVKTRTHRALSRLRRNLATIKTQGEG